MSGCLSSMLASLDEKNEFALRAAPYFSPEFGEKMNFIPLPHDGVTLRCLSRRFDCYTASLHQAMTVTCRYL